MPAVRVMSWVGRAVVSNSRPCDFSPPALPSWNTFGITEVFRVVVWKFLNFWVKAVMSITSLWSNQADFSPISKALTVSGRIRPRIGATAVSIRGPL